MQTLSVVAARRIAINAQGYAGRARHGTTRDVERAVLELSCVQLDSISVVERSHRIAIGSRVGSFPRDAVTRLLGSGRLFEYWAHEACLLPPRTGRSSARRWTTAAAAGFGRSSARIRTSAPRSSRRSVRAARSGPGTSRDAGGGMWNWKPAKATLDRLWNRGQLVIAGRQGFQRLYELPERVLPRSVLDAPIPAEPERLEALALKAVNARGILTESGVVEHWRLRGGTKRVRPVIDGLVGDGRLLRVQIDDGGPPALVAPQTDLAPTARSTATFLSPFDNLLWDRPFARRILGFDHLIEVYKPAPQRQYGYYVLPLLWRDRIVARADLKTDRTEGTLRVRSLHIESGIRSSAALDDAIDRALEKLRRIVGAERVER